MHTDKPEWHIYMDPVPDEEAIERMAAMLTRRAYRRRWWRSVRRVWRSLFWTST